MEVDQRWSIVTWNSSAASIALYVGMLDNYEVRNTQRYASGVACKVISAPLGWQILGHEGTPITMALPSNSVGRGGPDLGYPRASN